MGYDGPVWHPGVKIGWSTAKMLSTLIYAHCGAGATEIDYDWWANETELSVDEVRHAFEYLIDAGFAEIEDGILWLRSYQRLRDVAARKAKAEERAAKRAAKIALRSGQVNRKPIPSDVRAIVFARDSHRCVECGAADNLTLDHITPWSLGGPDTVENLRVLCRPCNSRKGDRT